MDWGAGKKEESKMKTQSTKKQLRVRTRVGVGESTFEVIDYTDEASLREIIARKNAEGISYKLTRPNNFPKQILKNEN